MPSFQGSEVWALVSEVVDHGNNRLKDSRLGSHTKGNRINYKLFERTTRTQMRSQVGSSSAAVRGRRPCPHVPNRCQKLSGPGPKSLSMFRCEMQAPRVHVDSPRVQLSSYV